ncbi:hypothetical protein G7046_g1182 [Stylonectria norvegica]|nr:hypothetical protein G7046_g1182 [Stylonectria norvegica]
MAAKQIVFITGANTGLGFEAIKALFKSPKPYRIFLGSRSLAKADEAIKALHREIPETESTVEAIQVDITDDDSINKAYETVAAKVDRIDALVNNAGAAFEPFFDKELLNARQIYNKSYDVNVSGTHVLTAQFVPLLLKSSSPRLVFLTSGLSTLSGAFTKLNPVAKVPIPTGWPKEGVVANLSYRASKAGLNLVMLGWHGILKGDGVKTFAISPGFLATNLGGDSEFLKKAGAGEPWLGGDLIKRVVEGERDADVGKVVQQNGGVQAW